jgi:hypothetical protein
VNKIHRQEERKALLEELRVALPGIQILFVARAPTSPP